MQYLNQLLLTILKELKAVKYTLGPVAKCVSCEEENLLEYISYNTDNRRPRSDTVANHLKCLNCAHPEAISISTAAVISKVIPVMSSINLHCTTLHVSLVIVLCSNL